MKATGSSQDFWHLKVWPATGARFGGGFPSAGRGVVAAQEAREEAGAGERASEG